MKWIIGIDEVGRGPLAGPVYICVVAIPLVAYKKGHWHTGTYQLTDSKKMAKRAREYWYERAKQMKDTNSVSYALASRSASAIDKKGISLCIRECIHVALETLALNPDNCIVLLDGGLKAPLQYKQQKTIIKGDLIEKAISLASVVAKVTRDSVMERLHKKYPLYHWAQNKGYGTSLHYKALLALGPTPYHRKSFLKRVLDK